MPVWEVLEQHGLEVYLVNAPHTQNVPGRKSAIEECPGLLKLHALGLLNNRFQPSDEIRRARSLGRHRGHGVAEASSVMQRMQKVGTEMNVQLSKVWSDLRGVSGRNMIPAIWDGERDPWTLVGWVQPGVQAPPEEIVQSWEGNGREEWLFLLRPHVELERIYPEKITDCDLQLRKHLESLGSKVDLSTQPLGPRPQGQKNSRNAPGLDLRTEL